jgi:hypothetical protein
LAAEAMRGRDAVFLEEPEHPGFRDMLAGRLDPEEYILEGDYEYPAFARGLCKVLKELHAAGTALIQLDPYMDVLVGIHERFAGGGSPADIREGYELQVYRKERRWFAALLDFYRLSMTGKFDQVVRSVKEFARVDAARGRLRDSMRAESLLQNITPFADAYVEAGYIHQYLPYRLKRLLPSDRVMERLWLMAPVTLPATGKSRIMGPGDVLTVAMTFKPDFNGPAADLLAARSLVHVKALAKEEMAPSPENPAPHTMDEIEIGRRVRKLSYQECRKLYRRMQRSRTLEAREFLPGHG